MIARRAWLVISIVWCFVWVALYVASPPLSPDEELNMRAGLTLVMALPWIVGLVVHCIVTGRWS
jgi:hypothetical protein